MCTSAENQNNETKKSHLLELYFPFPSSSQFPLFPLCPLSEARRGSSWLQTSEGCRLIMHRVAMRGSKLQMLRDSTVVFWMKIFGGKEGGAKAMLASWLVYFKKSKKNMAV